MILYVQGDLFQSPAQVLVNTVNTVGVMGKGVALQFKRHFPEMYGKYRELCEKGDFNVGSLWLYKSPNKWVLNFPTKRHWRQPSRIEDVESGLRKFVETYSNMGIHSIAFPLLGCGNGQLDFSSQVQPLIEKYLQPLPIEVFVYPDRDNVFVEHLQPGEMSDWLRTEPESLSFSEVWEDIESILKDKSEYETVAKKNPFSAYVSHEPRGIRVEAASQKYMLPYDTLSSLWQQLRTYGFSMRHIAPGIDRQVSYVLSIFAELEYVTPVYLADDYSKYESGSVIGLQILPSAFIQRTDYANAFQQF
ncbi:MAG: macro domain-containing protein [Caldilineaceae bacterium]|nr:macro domain-containing protein [Caldilineaceae bacterium]